jgi:hypothetical protein
VNCDKVVEQKLCDRSGAFIMWIAFVTCTPFVEVDANLWMTNEDLVYEEHRIGSIGEY